MSVSLKAMRYFCAALRQGSIARAAEEVNVAASAIAAAIDQIEDHFQLTLTIRTRARGIEPTADGKVMARRFQALLDDYEAMLRDGAERRQSLSGDLRIGYYAPVAPAFLPSILAPLTGPDHALTLHLDAVDNRAAQQGLRRGDYDAILFVSDTAEPGIGFAPLVEAPPYCLLPAGHRLAGCAAVSLADLADERLVSLERPHVGEYYRALVERAGAGPRIVAYSNATEMVRSLVAGQGVCAILNMLPLTDISYGGARVVAVPIRDPLPPLTLSVGYPPGELRRAVRAFVAECRAYFAKPGALICRAPPG